MTRSLTARRALRARLGPAVLLAASVVLVAACGSSAKRTYDGPPDVGGTAGTAVLSAPDDVTAVPTAVSDAPARPSGGCTTTATTAAAPSGQSVETLNVNGSARTYRIYLPPAVSTGKPLPVVLNLHGLTSNSDNQMQVSQFEPLAATEGFIVVAPDGLGPPSHWEYPNDPTNSDLPFFNSLLDQVEADHCVDTARVYSTGISNGGMMSATLSCQMGSRFAAVGLVSGIRQQQNCTPPDQPMPVVVFWGKQDVVLPFYGGLGPALKMVTDPAHADPNPQPPTSPPADLQGFPPVEQVVSEWAAHDGCSTTPTTFTVGSEVEERVYTGCQDGSQVRFYVIADGGHNWPGSAFFQQFNDPSNAVHKLTGTSTDQVDATKVIWSFFKGYALTN